jgi:hypothetical protein
MHFLGAVRGVSARWRGEDPLGDPSELSVLLECERGLGTVHCSLAAVPWELGFTVRGTRGTIRVDLARQQALLMTPVGGPRPIAALRMAARAGLQSAAGNVRRVTGKLSGRLRGYPGLRPRGRFTRACATARPPPVPFTDGGGGRGARARAPAAAARRDVGRRDDVLGRRHA